MNARFLISSLSGFIFYIHICHAQDGTKFSPAIEDNSMFIEEAYNQESKVVQHISNFIFVPDFEDNFVYAFTQEWPLAGLHHQISYTLQYSSIKSTSERGFGDLYINYRYQLSYKENFITSSPRLSLILPTGSASKGLGDGSWGLQFNMPMSKRWTNHFVSHLNLGTTWLAEVEDSENNYKRSLSNYFAGISAIWLINSKLNLMLECTGSYNGAPDEDNSVRYFTESIIAPAIRYAIDIGGTQIVPGISMPVSFEENSKAALGAFFYLSIEHGY